MYRLQLGCSGSPAIAEHTLRCRNPYGAFICVDSLLHYIEQWDYDYNDVIAIKKIRGQVKKAINESFRQMT
jgi:hypothetical protein